MQEMEAEEMQLLHKLSAHPNWPILVGLVNRFEMKAYKLMGRSNGAEDLFRKQGVVQGIEQISNILELIAKYDPNLNVESVENDWTRDKYDRAAGN